MLPLPPPLPCLPPPPNTPQGKKLADGDMYIITIIDMEPAGLLVKAYNQSSNAEYTLSPTEVSLSVYFRSERRTLFARR